MSPTASPVRKLVAQIEDEIAQGEVPVGGVLGTEQELCARYGVSPTIFRQAARVLESYDLATMRPGNRGGLVVHGYGLDGAARSLAIYLEFTGAQAADVQAVSGAVLALVPRIAAARMSLEVADALRAGLRDIATLPTAYERGTAFIELFQSFVESTGNPLLAFTFRVATQFLYDVTAFDTGSIAQFDRASVVADNLFEAVIGNDLLEADRALHTWLEIHRAPTPAVSSDGAGLAGGSARTRSEQLARRLLREIRAANWPVGTRLGAETDLLDRYEVSRATFRQTVRLLEQYCAVKSRRGPQGGLFVTAPEPRHVDSLSSAALRDKGLTRAHVLALAPALTALSVDLAIARDRAALVTTLERARAGAHLPGALADLNLAIAEVGNNPFVKALVRLIAELEPSLDAPTNWNWAARAEHLLDEAGRALGNGDVGRLKRALVELATNCDFGAGAPGLPSAT